MSTYCVCLPHTDAWAWPFKFMFFFSFTDEAAEGRHMLP